MALFELWIPNAQDFDCALKEKVSSKDNSLYWKQVSNKAILQEYLIISKVLF